MSGDAGYFQDFERRSRCVAGVEPAEADRGHGRCPDSSAGTRAGRCSQGKVESSSESRFTVVRSQVGPTGGTSQASQGRDHSKVSGIDTHSQPPPISGTMKIPHSMRDFHGAAGAAFRGNDLSNTNDCDLFNERGQRTGRVLHRDDWHSGSGRNGDWYIQPGQVGHCSTWHLSSLPVKLGHYRGSHMPTSRGRVFGEMVLWP